MVEKILYLLLGFALGLVIPTIIRRAKELIYIFKCKTRFSRCLDCSLHNNCYRYSKHTEKM